MRKLYMAVARGCFESINKEPGKLRADATVCHAHCFIARAQDSCMNESLCTHGDLLTLMGGVTAMVCHDMVPDGDCDC